MPTRRGTFVFHFSLLERLTYRGVICTLTGSTPGDAIKVPGSSYIIGGMSSTRLVEAPGSTVGKARPARASSGWVCPRGSVTTERSNFSAVPQDPAMVLPSTGLPGRTVESEPETLDHRDEQTCNTPP